MPRLKKTVPVLFPDETIILREQGGYRAHAGAGWKVMDCMLTNRRLILWQLRKVIEEIPMDGISDLRTEKHYYVLRRRDAIGIYFRHAGSSRTKVVWIIVNGAHIWKARLFQMALLKVDEKLITILAERLDDSCRAILWHLWETRHARIVELAEVCGTDNHMDVLMHIKDAINPVAVREIGCPLLFFERKRAAPDTGEPILFSWWLAGSREGKPAQKERLMDIFDEGDYFQIILEVKRVEKSDLNISVDGRELTIESRNIRSRWVERFHLPDTAVFDNHQVSLKHSLLEIRLRKANECVE